MGRSQVKKIAFVLLLSIAHWACAYELSIPCKSADGWKVVQGQCDDNGLLQGIGSATLDPTDGVRPKTMATGPFKNGLPNGNMTLQFDLQWRNTATMGQYRLEVGGSCNLEFVDGKVLNSALSCTNNSTKTTVTVKPGAGKIVWAKAPGGRGATLTIDLPEVQIDGGFNSLDSRLFKPFENGEDRVPGTFAGKADVFLLETTGGTKVTIKNLSGAFSNKAVEISGTFTAACFHFFGCALSPYRVARTGGAVDARGLIRVTPAGSPVRYEMVFNTTGRGVGNPVLLYFKDDQIEFDATTTNCGDNAFGAELAVKDKRFDILPYCGKITPRNGRGYEGLFRNGRPIQQ